jgi:hypothetical protein
MKSFEQKLLGRLYCFCGGGDDNDSDGDAARAEQEGYDMGGAGRGPSMDSMDDDPELATSVSDTGVMVAAIRIGMITAG